MGPVTGELGHGRGTAVGVRRPLRRLLRLVLGAPALVALLLIAAPAAARAVEVDWGEPTATATYGESVVFEQPATLPGDVARLEVLIETPGALGPGVTDLGPPGGDGGPITLNHELSLAEGHLLPNTTVTARWRVVGEDGSESIGPPVTVRYDDTRFDWRTREGDVVRVHWYEGSDEFGQRALEIGERAVQETSELLGVTEDEPVDFFVYADQQEFYEALGPGTRENVGGQANAELRTLFALITPGEINDPWVSIVIPHELVHLVFDTAVDNPYHFPPRWLNEGLAVYLSQGYDDQDRFAVEQAASTGSLIPLEGLTGQFPTTQERFFLAYAESVSAVDFFIRQHGQAALVELVRSYATGLTDDEAFEQAIGMDVAAFDAAWRSDLGAGEPAQHGPRPAPAGPLPPGWETADGSAAPTVAPRPGTSPAPGAPAPAVPGVGGDGGSSLPLVAIAAVVVAVGLVVATFLVLSRRRRAVEQARVSQWAAWRTDRESALTTAVLPAPETAPAGAQDAVPAPGDEPMGPSERDRAPDHPQ